MRALRTALIALVLGGCGSAASGGSAASEPAESEPAAGESATNGAETPPAATAAPPPSTATMVLSLSAIPSCDADLRLYERCEPALRPSIASGDRRDFAHERAWIAYLEGTPEAAGLPDACAAMGHDLAAVCP